VSDTDMVSLFFAPIELFNMWHYMNRARYQREQLFITQTMYITA
jgi:hypothetical protein